MRLIFFVIASSVLLTGCFGFVRDAFDTRKNPGPCPVGGALYDVARIIVFREDGSETFGNVEFTGDVRDVRLFCRYADKDPLRAEVEIDFAFGRGPAAVDEKYTFKYFVAVTRRNSEVLNKKEFEIETYFVDGPVVEDTQLIAPLVIPRADETISGANFEVIVGFVLTDEQLEFNRSGRRFRLNVGE